MAKLEQLEMDAHRGQLTSDLRGLFEKYRSIFGWDVPENDEPLSDRLILAALHRALDELDAKSSTIEPR